MKNVSIKNLNKNQKKLRKRIIDISFSQRLSHLGSCLSSVDIIDAIYKIKKPKDIFILSNGHAGIAWYVVLEKYNFLAENETKLLHIHPDRNIQNDIYVSTGSLGQGLPIAVGMAIANRKRAIYCMISDGECAEGSIWEALRVASEKKVTNLKIIVNANGWGAYDKVNLSLLKKRIRSFGFTIHTVRGQDMNTIIKGITYLKSSNVTILFAHTNSDQFSFLKGQDAHYYVMTEDDYQLANKQLL